MDAGLRPLHRMSSDRIRIQRWGGSWSASCPCCRMEEHLPSFDLARVWSYLHISRFHKRAAAGGWSSGPCCTNSTCPHCDNGRRNH